MIFWHDIRSLMTKWSAPILFDKIKHKVVMSLYKFQALKTFTWGGALRVI